MNFGMALLAQTSSMRGFRDCEFDLATLLILLTVLVIFTFAGDRIAKLWKRTASVKGKKCLIAAAIVAVVVVAVAVGFSLTLARPNSPKVSDARPVSAPP